MLHQAMEKRVQSVGNEMTVFRPQATAPLAPNPINALAVLQQSMTSSAGSNDASKNERAAYGAAAEALRDEEGVRLLKLHVGQAAIRDLYANVKDLERSIFWWGVAEKMCAGLLLLWSIAMSVSSISSHIESAKSYVPLYTIVGALASFGFFASRRRSSLSETLRQTHRDIIKKETYAKMAKTLGTGTAASPSLASSAQLQDLLRRVLEGETPNSERLWV
uniref:NS3 protein n=2 Tax=Wad Medani virus TaxID=40067 RepID=A0A343RD81_9REOV|nr:NS3 protein [Wad Medani virus]